MPMLRRRRPLLRAAAVRGGAYATQKAFGGRLDVNRAPAQAGG